jgi:aminoglycoside phosphotransferase (APT) family kinase protein
VIPATGLGAGPGGWEEVVTSRIERLRSAYHDIDDVSVSLVDDGMALVCRLAQGLSPVVRPAVAHLDVHLPNILLDHQAQFRALLDLEHVRWVDPVMDFVKPAMWIFTHRPGWAEAFVEGYRATGGWPARWPQRISVASGLELLTGVEYWTRVSDQEMREDYLQRLWTWVRSDGETHVWSDLTL